MFPASTNGGGVEFAFPDVCKTPSPGGPVPTPYPNGIYEVKNSASKSSVKSTTSGVKVTSGNEAGKKAGVVSSITMGILVGNAPLLRHLVDKAQAKGYKVMVEVKGTGKATLSLQGAITTNRTSTQSSRGSMRSYVAHSGTEGMERLLRRLG